MTSSYYLAKREPISDIEFGKEYRVIGRIFQSGCKFLPIKREGDLIYFRGYVRGVNINLIKIFEI